MSIEKIDWKKYPKRRCQTMHVCQICKKPIHTLEKYYDGGYGKRAHIQCVGAQNDR